MLRSLLGTVPVNTHELSIPAETALAAYTHLMLGLIRGQWLLGLVCQRLAHCLA